MTSMDRFLESEAKRELPAIMEATREAYGRGLRGAELELATRKALAESVCRQMEQEGR